MFLESFQTTNLPPETSMVPVQYVSRIQKVAMGDVRAMTGNAVPSVVSPITGYSLVGCIESDRHDLQMSHGTAEPVAIDLDVVMQKPHPREWWLSVGFGIEEHNDATVQQVRETYDFRWQKNSAFALAIRTVLRDVSAIPSNGETIAALEEGRAKPTVAAIGVRSVVHHPVSADDCARVERRVYDLGLSYLLGRRLRSR